MSLILLFLVLLVLIFAVLLYFLKPSSMERAVQDQLESIGEAESGSAAVTSILKERTITSNVMDDLTNWLPWSESTTRLINQAGKEWSFGLITALSLVVGVATYGFASVLNVAQTIAMVLGIAAASAP